MILGTPPNVPLKQIVQYGTDVIIASDGTEQRIATKKNPRQLYSAQLVLEDESKLRELRELFYSSLDVTVQFPLWQEGISLGTAVAPAATILLGDFSLSDITDADTIFILHPDGITSETQDITTKSDTQITVPAITNAYPAGARMYPIENAYIEDRATIQRFPSTAGTHQLALLIDRQISVTGFGAAARTSYQSFNVLDRRPVMGATVGVSFDGGIENIDFGNKLTRFTDFPHAAGVSPKRFLILDQAERQYFKAFMADIAGGREPFWVPTWRPDLSVTVQPSASDTFTVDEPPDYKATYFDTGAIIDLQLELADGTIEYRRVTGVVDNGSDQTITVDSALPGSDIDVCSFLELGRLATNRVTWDHFANRSRITFSISTTQG